MRTIEALSGCADVAVNHAGEGRSLLRVPSASSGGPERRAGVDEVPRPAGDRSAERKTR